MSSSRSSFTQSTYRRISKEELFVGSLLAQGGTGIVHKGKLRGESVVVKQTKQALLSDLNVASAYAKELEREAIFLSMFHHPAIVRCEGLCLDDKTSPLLVLEKASGVPLSALLSSRQKPLSLEKSLSLAIQLAEAVKYLHDQGICHRDIKGQNIIVNTNTMALKLIDFGLARSVPPDGCMTPRSGSYRWASPENLRGESYGLSTDVFSFGIILWQLVTGQYPYPNYTGEQVGSMVAYHGARPMPLHMTKRCPPALCELTHACWSEDPAMRPSMESVVGTLQSILSDVVKTGNSSFLRRGSVVVERVQRVWNRILHSPITSF